MTNPKISKMKVEYIDHMGNDSTDSALVAVQQWDKTVLLYQ